jgi:uncharacterized protein YlaN (UPF0358 family)
MITLSTEIKSSLHQRALQFLHEDADKISKLIEVQMENLTAPKCPLYEEVLDTQMFGFSREIDFATRIGLITKEQGKLIIHNLEQRLSALYEAMEN